MSFIDKIKNTSVIDKIKSEMIYNEDERQVEWWTGYRIGYDIAVRDVLRYGDEYAKKELEYYKNEPYTIKGFIDGYDDYIYTSILNPESWWKVD